MPVILATRLDPLGQQLHLPGVQLTVRLRGRHTRVGIGRRNARQELAIGQARRVDRPHTFARLGGAAVRVEPQAGLALGRIRPVALETGIG